MTVSTLKEKNKPAAQEKLSIVLVQGIMRILSLCLHKENTLMVRKVSSRSFLL